MSVARFRPALNPATTATKWCREQYPELDSYAAVLGPATTNEDLFNTVGKPLVDEMMAGKNTCVLLYGQTRAGKTHSCVGPPSDPGLLPRAVNYLFDACGAKKRSMRFRVSVSIVECYKEEMRDLIAPDAVVSRFSNTSCGGAAAAVSAAVGAGAPLQMREKNGVFFLPDANVRVCSSAEAVLREIKLAFENRTSGNSYLSDVSSRAHAVATISLAAETNVKGASPVLILSRISFVDLCGSEVLTDAFGAVQQSETKSINKSLFCLRGVVSALAEKANFIPYRDSELTKLLKATLSRASMNCIVCALSPDASDATLTAGSISFGNVARKIEQDIVRRVFVRPDKVKMKDEADEDLIRIEDVKKQQQTAAAAAASTAQQPIVCTKMQIDTRQGTVAGYLFARRGMSVQDVINSGKCIGLALHAFGGGCCGVDMLDFAAPSISAGHLEGVFAADFPGFGSTQGARQASRTESLWKDGEVMEIVVDLLEFATDKKRTRQVVLFGWDWGGNMALSLAVSSAYKSRVRAVCLYHPSWTQPHEALAAIKVPVLFLWDPTDTLHLIAHGRKMCKLISKSKLVQMKPPAGQSGERAKYYEALWTICGTQSASFIEKNAPSSPGAGAGAAKPKAKAAAAATSVAATVGPTTTTTTTTQSQAPQQPPPSSSDDENEDDTDYDADEGMGIASESLDDLSDFSRESSFLGVLLQDPEVVDAMCAAETAKRLRNDAKKVREVAVRDPAANTLFDTLAALKLSNMGSVTAEHVNKIAAVLGEIFLRDETRLALAYAILGRNAALRSRCIGAIGLCPTALPYWSARSFEACGLLPRTPVGAHDPQWASSKLFRYLPGRTVQVPLPGECLHLDMSRPALLGTVLPGIDAATLTAKRQATARSACIYSFRCRIVAPVSATLFRVAIEVNGGGAATTPLFITVSLGDLEAMNAPTAFPPSGSSKDSLMFEDAIRGRYDSLSLRMKLAECCAAIAPVVATMDFAAAWKERVEGSNAACPANNRLLAAQMQCVTILRKHVDIRHHVQMGKDPNRALVPDVGSLAVHGQWHCHGTSSVLNGVLLPFASLLGISVRQRDGYCGRGSAEGGRPVMQMYNHTWCEVSFHPSGVNFCTDPSFSPHMEPTLLTFSEAYCSDGARYPMRDLTSASKGTGPALMDRRQCVLLNEENPIDADVKAAAALPQMVFDDSKKTLSFVK